MKFFKAAATTALLAFGSVPGVLASKPDPEDPAVVAAQDADHLRRKVGHYFQMLDENGDGFIGVDEVEAKASGLVKQLLNVDINDPEFKPYKVGARAMLEKGVTLVDANGDQQIELEELLGKFDDFQQILGEVQKSFMKMMMDMDKSDL
eukprot:INCI4745.1.p1 GENE.INCI4745.1~~INCI4745.1.p1  ORF type:complete len:149 (+),score=37.66 INCI4745.1:137-583(+)